MKKSEKTNYRNGEFEPKIVPKNTRDVLGIEDKIISLYAKGLSTTPHLKYGACFICTLSALKIKINL